MLSQARDLASRQRIHRPSEFRSGTVRKAPAKPGRWLGEVIEKFLRAKSNRSAAYMDKLNADMRLFQAHFAGNRQIDRIRSDEIEDFLDSKKAAARRRNNLRSETLFRYAQIRLRALHRDLKTEAELVLTKGPNQAQTRENIPYQQISDVSKSCAPEANYRPIHLEIRHRHQHIVEADAHLQVGELKKCLLLRFRLGAHQPPLPGYPLGRLQQGEQKQR